MSDLRIDIFNFVHVVLERFGETIFDLRQKRDALRYIERSRAQVALGHEYIRMMV